MVKMFQYFESPTYVILFNSFYFSMFAFMEMLYRHICIWACRKMCRIEDIMNFHGSLTFDMFKMFQYFESPSYVIFQNGFYFSIFAFMEMLLCLVGTCVCHKMCRIEGITNFHGSLALSSRKTARYFKSPYYPILLNRF